MFDLIFTVVLMMLFGIFYYKINLKGHIKRWEAPDTDLTKMQKWGSMFWAQNRVELAASSVAGAFMLGVLSFAGVFLVILDNQPFYMWVFACIGMSISFTLLMLIAISLVRFFRKGR